jgi:hypothetical protein
MQNTRLRRANDGVLTEMARSLLREDVAAGGGMERRNDPLRSDASGGRSADLTRSGGAEGGRHGAPARGLRWPAGSAGRGLRWPAGSAGPRTAEGAWTAARGVRRPAWRAGRGAVSSHRGRAAVSRPAALPA